MKKPTKVFLDANVVIRQGKPPGGPLFFTLVDLVKAGFITILTTDLTKNEITKKHVEDDYDVVKEFGREHFRRIIEEVVSVPMPEITKDKIKATLWEKYTRGVRRMFADLKAETLSIDEVRPSIVLDSYTHRTGLFSG